MSYLKSETQDNPNSEQRYGFSDWRLAFEVPLAKCKHDDLPGAAAPWHTRFESSSVYKQFGQNSACELDHIYMNLQGLCTGALPYEAIY